MRLLWLVDELRRVGLTVREYPGWQTRGSASWGPLRGVVCHATAGSRTSTDAGETRVLWVTGSSSAPAPISQLYLSRSGAWTVGASGRCNHVLVGDKGPHRGYGNDALIGVEAANDNRGEPWPAVQVDSYHRGVAAICRKMGWDASVVVAHREHQSGKSDPLGIDMTAFRRRAADLIEEDDMALNDIVPASGNRSVGVVLSDIWSTVATGRSGFVPSQSLWLGSVLTSMAQTLAAIAAKVDLDPAELTKIEAAALAGAEAGVVAAADDLVAAILAGLPDRALTRADVEAALRSVLGSLDGS